MIGEVADRLYDSAPGLRCRNDLQQVEISRRIEEVRAEPVLPEVIAASFRQRRDGDA